MTCPCCTATPVSCVMHACPAIADHVRLTLWMLQAEDDVSAAAAAAAPSAATAAGLQRRTAGGIRERKGLSLAGRIQQSFQREEAVLTFGKVQPRSAHSWHVCA